MKRNTKIMLILLIVAVVLVMISIIAMMLSPQTAQKRRISAPIIGNLDLDGVNTIEINNDAVLSKYNDIWVYTSSSKEDEQNTTYPVKQNNVDKMLSMLKRFGYGRLITDEPKGLDVYRLDEENKPKMLLLRNQEDEELFRVKIGVVAGANTANYAQINDEPAVYLVDDDIANILTKDAKYWFDLRLFPASLKKNRVTKITIARKNLSDISLVKDAKEWTSTSHSNIKIDTIVVEKYIDDILTTNAHDFSSQSARDEIIDGTVTINMGDKDTLRVTLYAFADKYFVNTQGGQDDYVFHVQEYTVNKLFPNIDTFKADEVEEDKEASTADSDDKSDN